MKSTYTFAIVTTIAGAFAGCSAAQGEGVSAGEALGAADCSAARPWETWKAYAVGDLVTYAGATYRCVQPHTSQPGWTPDAVAALWTPASCSGAGGGIDAGPPVDAGTDGGTDASHDSGTGHADASDGSATGDAGGAFTQSRSTWYCGSACGSDDTSSCGTTYCGSQVDPHVVGAALSLTRMNGPSGTYMGGGLCGRKIEIHALDTDKRIVVPVIDACVACMADDHVDLTLGAWQALGIDPCLGTFRQEWRFVN